MSTTPQFTTDICKLLLEWGNLRMRGEEEVVREVAQNDERALVPKLLDLNVNSEAIAKACSISLGVPCYPFDKIAGEGSQIPDLPATLEAHANWVFCANKICYVLNPLDQDVLQLVLDKFTSKGIIDCGVISKARLLEIVGGATAVLPETAPLTSQKGKFEHDLTMVRQIEEIIREAAQINASDIHFEARVGNHVQVRMRVDGDLRVMNRITHKVYEQWANIILSRCTKGKPGTFIEPLDDMFVFELPGPRKIKLRVSMFPVVLPETEQQLPKFTLRLLGNRLEQIQIDHLGIAEYQGNDQLTRIRMLCERKNGLILVSGPTGSGKTTTLSAILSEMLNIYPNREYYTIEDPVEISINGVNHVQVNPEAQLTFARAVKGFLRADPDVIMVGEIRDKEVAVQALTASITGHLVMSTIHTNSAIESINRLIDIGCDRYTVANALKAATAQRLAKKLCPHCCIPARWGDLVDGTHAIFQQKENKLLRLRYSNAPSLYKDLDDYPPLDHMVNIASPAGCQKCDKGYKGRVLVTELLEISPKIQDMIARNESLAIIKAQAVKENFKELWQHCMTMIYQGITSFDEMVSSIGEREAVISDDDVGIPVHARFRASREAWQRPDISAGESAISLFNGSQIIWDGMALPAELDPDRSLRADAPERALRQEIQQEAARVAGDNWLLMSDSERCWLRGAALAARQVPGGPAHLGDWIRARQYDTLFRWTVGWASKVDPRPPPEQAIKPQTIGLKQAVSA